MLHKLFFMVFACIMIEDPSLRRRMVLIMCRLRDSSTLKGHVESVVKAKNIDVDTIQQAYTV